MVKNKTLLILASIVWCIAGFNIVRIGFMAYVGHFSLLHAIGSALVFAAFWQMFSRLTHKHKRRIKAYLTDKQYFWRFFDLKSFLMMAFMMTLGITLRVEHLVPEVFIAVFYSGLGIALSMAGIQFAIHYKNYDC